MHRQPRFLVAHRAGNDLDDLRAVASVRPRLVECDLRRWRGRIEVRHVKTVGPLPVYWDTWHLAGPRTRHLLLDELLAAADEVGVELMLDLKGRDLRLAHEVVAALAARPAAGPVTVCARRWALLEPFEDLAGVRTVWSVGTRRGLRRLLATRRSRMLGGVSIHADLLDRRVVAELGVVADVVMTWPVNCPDRGRRLLDWGVHGLITDDAHALAPLVADRPGAARGAVA
jgi:glycerophosphoryl diester phosphodiesterase